MAKKEARKAGGKEKALLENTIALQRVLTELAARTADLTSRIDKLLELFEAASKAFEKGDSLTKKIDTIIEQNSTIAQGLVAVLKESTGVEVSEEKEEKTKEGIERKASETLVSDSEEEEIPEEAEEQVERKIRPKPLPEFKI